MKAIKNCCKKINYIDVQDPRINSHFNVLVKVMSAGLCGSDMQRIDYINSVDKEINHPILGHEISGVIEKIYGDVKSKKKLTVGDRVVVEPIIYCRHCSYCKQGNFQFCENIIALGKNIDGGFSEKVKVPIENVHKLPEYIDFDTGVFFDLCSVCTHILNLSGKIKNKTVAIIGDGALGLTLASLVQSITSNFIVIGKRNINGYNFVNYLDESSISSMRSKFDVVVETVGRNNCSSINQAISICKIKGKIVVAGVFVPEYKLPLTARDLFYKEITMVGANSYSYDHDKQRSETVEAMAILSGNHEVLRKLISHKSHLSDFSKGLDAFKNKDKSHAIKIVFNPN